jgi:hypothetical protein
VAPIGPNTAAAPDGAADSSTTLAGPDDRGTQTHKSEATTPPASRIFIRVIIADTATSANAFFEHQESPFVAASSDRKVKSAHAFPQEAEPVVRFDG